MFSARRSPLILAIVIGDAILMIGFVIWFLSDAPPDERTIRTIIGLSILASLPLVAWVLLGTAYEITESHLVTHRGPFRSRIPLSNIDEVFLTTGQPTSPVWAQDQLQVMYRAGDRASMIIVNPEDKSGFLQRLAAADPALRLQGDRVQRQYS